MTAFSSGRVLAVSLSSSARYVAAASIVDTEVLTVSSVPTPTALCTSLLPGNLSVSAPSVVSLTFSGEDSVYTADSRGGVARYRVGHNLERQFRIPAAHTGASVLDVAAAKDFLVSCGKDDLIRCWDVETQECVAKLKGHQREVRAVAVAQSYDNQLPVHLVASGGRDRTARLWDVRAGAGTPIHVFAKHTGWVHDVALCAGPKPRLLSCAGDKTVRVWDLVAMREEYVLNGHEFRVWGVAAPASGHFALSGSTDATVRAWNLAENVAEEDRCVVLDGHRDSVLSVSVSQDASVAVSGCNDGSLFLWDCASIFSNRASENDDEPDSQQSDTPQSADYNEKNAKKANSRSHQERGETQLESGSALKEERRTAAAIASSESERSVNFRERSSFSNKSTSKQQSPSGPVVATSEKARSQDRIVRHLEEEVQRKDSAILEREHKIAQLEKKLQEQSRQIEQLKLQAAAAENLAKEANVRALFAENKTDIDETLSYTEPIRKISEVTGQLKALASRLDQMIVS